MHAGLPIHPLANIHRLMKGAEYDALVEDIRARGVINPVTLYQGKLLDGRNRQRAALDADQSLATVTYEGDDPLGHMLALNAHRRHDSEGQRGMAASRLATLPKGNPANAPWGALTQEAAADLFGVHRNTVQRARVVLENALPEIIEAVEDGIMPVKVAASIAKQEPDKQRARLARDKRKLEGTHRHKDDFYRTPDSATLALLAVEEFPARIWEPACGDGAIAKVLVAAGYEVISTDLMDRGYGESEVDFLEQTKKRCGCIITNPPFVLDDDFALHALKLGVRKFALLCRLAWLEGVERYETLFALGKLARVWVFAARQTLWFGDDEFPETDGGMTAYAWFVFEHGHDGSPTLGWLAPGDADDCAEQ